MAINKVVFGNNTLIDLTNDTVSADKLLQGVLAHNNSGNVISGTAYPVIEMTYEQYQQLSQEELRDGVARYVPNAPEPEPTPSGGKRKYIFNEGQIEDFPLKTGGGANYSAVIGDEDITFNYYSTSSVGCATSNNLPLSFYQNLRSIGMEFQVHNFEETCEVECLFDESLANEGNSSKIRQDQYLVFQYRGQNFTIYTKYSIGSSSANIILSHYVLFPQYIKVKKIWYTERE